MKNNRKYILLADFSAGITCSVSKHFLLTNWSKTSTLHAIEFKVDSQELPYDYS